MCNRTIYRCGAVLVVGVDLILGPGRRLQVEFGSDCNQKCALACPRMGRACHSHSHRRFKARGRRICTLLCVNALHQIQGDPYVGVCMLSNTSFSRWWLSLTPLAIASSIGSVAFALGLCSLRSVKDHMEIDSGTKNKLEVFVARMTGFSVFVLAPQLTQMCLKFYEADNQVEWETNYYGKNCDDLFVPCLKDEAVTQNTPSTAFIIARYIIMLLPALAPLTWIANSESIIIIIFIIIIIIV